MKILHVITSLRTGGAEKLMVDLLPRLKSDNTTVELLLFDGTRTAFRDELEKAGIKVSDLGIGGSVYSPLKLFKLYPYLKKFDIIHTHNTAPQFFAAICSMFCRTKLITTEHGGSNRRRNIKWFRPIDRWMYNRYSRVICISRKAEDNLRKHLQKFHTEICTINNGVDIDKYASASASPLLESIAKDSRKIIMVAGFRWEKDQDTLIRAMKHLPEKFHLFFVGDGVRRQECEQLSRNENVDPRVHFLGIRNDVANLLHAADYVVMSSHFEGLSLSSVEGMSVGKPFLASDVDGLREVVKGAGILFPHGDSKEFANEITKLEASETLYKNIENSCYDRAREYDISKMVHSYSSLYN